VNGVRVVWNPTTRQYETRLDIRVPSEPRKYKRTAQNPFGHRKGRGQTSDYRAEKIATQTLSVRKLSDEETRLIDHERAMTKVTEALDPTARLMRVVNYK
jgi:hypothetical protein